jgi:hypothetical protein
MELGLYDARGHRKYLTTAERTAFLTAAEETPREVRTLCSLLAHTVCRLSEALWLTADRVDLRAEFIVFATLKKRRPGVYRALPVPHVLVDMLDLDGSCKFVICDHPIEQDQRGVKRVTRPMLGFKSFEAAQDTLVGIELMHMIKKKQRIVEARDEGLTAAEQFYALAA